MKALINQFFIDQDSDSRFFIILALSLSLILGISYILGNRVERGVVSTPTETVSVPFPPVSLEARAAYVYDARTKTVLFAHNENTRLPLASVTKLMSALVARELSPQYSTVTVSLEALKAEGDSGLRSGEEFSLKDLLDFSLVSSSNDGMRAIALSLGALSQVSAEPKEILGDFVRQMNNKAFELGLTNTYFRNETGLDETEVKGGAYGTAKDVTTLMEYITLYHLELLEATQYSSATLLSLDDFEHVARNTNNLAGSIPGLLGSKTGFTNTAGGNLTFAFDPELGRPIIITILGSTEEGRFKDAKKLITATLEHINGIKN